MTDIVGSVAVVCLFELHLMMQVSSQYSIYFCNCSCQFCGQNGHYDIPLKLELKP